MENKKREVAIDMDKLMNTVYNKIVVWNNEDYTTDQKIIELKILSHDIITDILTVAFNQLEGVTTREQVLPQEAKKKKSNFLQRVFKK